MGTHLSIGKSTYFSAPKPCKFVGIKLCNVDLINKDFSAGWFIEAADHIK